MIRNIIFFLKRIFYKLHRLSLQFLFRSYYSKKTLKVIFKNCNFFEEFSDFLVSKEVIEKYLNHEFNFLSTDYYKMTEPPESLTKKSILTTPLYKCIDWQLDPKSGYRWNIEDWHTQISIKPEFHADIKMPWEIARLQHLVQMAFLS